MDLEVIRNILVQAKTVGVEQTTAQLKGLSAGYEGVTVASQKTETATESVARKFQRLEGILDPAARAARQLAKDISTLDAALAQGGTSAERHAQLLSAATANALKMSAGVTQSSAAQKVWAEATAAANQQAKIFASNAGSLGFLLSAVGKGGVLAAAGIGALVLGYRALADASHAVGQKAIEIKKFSDTTGLSVTQVQALRIEGAKFSLSSEDIEHALRTMSVRWEDLRTGQGEALKVLQRYKPGLVDAAAGMEDAEDRLNLLREAFDGLTVSQQNALSKGFFGKAGIEQAQLFKQLDIGKITKDYAEAGRGLSEEQVKTISKLEIENQSLRKIAGESFAKLFAPDVLSLENSFLRGLIEINHQLKELIKNREEGQKKSLLGELAKLAAQSLLPVPSAIVSGVIAFDPVVQAKAQADQMKVLLNRQTELNEAMATYQSQADEAGKWPIDLVFQMEKAVAELDKVNAKIDDMRDKGPGIQLIARDAGIKDIKVRGEKTSEFDIVQEQKRIALLGEAATAAEKQALSLSILKKAYEDGGLSAKDYQRAVDAVNTSAAALTATHQASIQTLQARTAAEREAAAAATVRAGGGGDVDVRAQQAVTMEVARRNVLYRDEMKQLELQLSLVRARSDTEKQSVQLEIDYQQAKDRGLTQEQAMNEAMIKRKITQEEINAAEEAEASRRGPTTQFLEGQNQALADQYERIKQIQATEANRATAISQANRAIQDQNSGLAESVRLAKEYAAWVEKIYAGMTLLSELDFTTTSEKAVQQERKQPGILVEPWWSIQEKEKYGGSRIISTGQGIAAGESTYSQQQLENRVNDILKRGGGVGGAIGELGRLGTRDTASQDAITQEIQTLIDMLDPSQQAGAKAAEIARLKSQPETMARDQAIKSLTEQMKESTDATKDNTASQNALSGLYSRQFGQGFYDGGAAVGDLIYGLDNNTGGAIDDMQKAANDNAKTQNDLLRNLSQSQISSISQMGGGIVNATYNVQSELRSGFANLVMAVKTPAGTTPSTPSGTSPTTWPPLSPPPPHILGFARGGSFTTAGYGGDDTNVVAFRVSPQRERVTITPVAGSGRDGGNVNHFYNDITVTIPQNTDEFRSSAMQVADEIFNQVAIAGRRK